MVYAEYLEPSFRLREAAAAAAFPLNTLRSYYQRGWFQSFGDGMGQGKGRAQRLCLGDILVLAIASRLINVGLSPTDAYNAAYSFGVAAKTPKGLARRMPFELFDEREFVTVFVFSMGSTAQVIPVRKGEGIGVNDLGLEDEFGDATITISLNAVERVVFTELGLPLPIDGNGP